MSGSPASATVVAQLVETMRALAGPHPGFRPVHAKGIVCSGTFRASAGARAVSRALHLEGQAVPTVVRFSNSSGDPDVHDGIANARALAVKFQLPDGKNADILALHIEGFPARTPDEFLAFLRAQLPDSATGQPAPDAVPRFLESHPATRAFIERLTKKPVPVSYGQACYYAEHAFQFTAPDGSSRFGRYRWTPEAGEVYLSPDDASKRSANFLREELEGRLSNWSCRVRPPAAIGWRERSDRRRHRLVAVGPAPGRAGTARGDTNLPDQRGRTSAASCSTRPT
jgi:catalase